MGRVCHAFDFSRSVASNNLQLRQQFTIKTFRVQQFDQSMYQFSEQLSAGLEYITPLEFTTTQLIRVLTMCPVIRVLTMCPVLLFKLHVHGLLNL